MKLISWFTESTSLIIQILVVVALVLIVGFVDPFGIFSSQKLKLKNTPIDVQSIKGIGELITAEYYGEVVSSFTEQVEISEKDNANDFEVSIKELQFSFFDIILDLKANGKLKKRKVYDYFLEEHKSIREMDFYDEFIFFVFKNEIKDTYNKRDLKRTISASREERLVKHFFKKSEKELRFIQEDVGYCSGLIDVFSTDLVTSNAKEYKKKQLVLLGRGWVKAGYDFGELNADNFRYDPSTRLVYFIGLEPQILSSTINPWFIPEKEVPGFEFLVYTRGAKKDYSILQIVKQGCYDKLVAKAHERNILQLAEDNAREHIKSLFSLLIDGGVRDVIFCGDKFDFAYTTISLDSVIRGEELLFAHEMEKKPIERSTWLKVKLRGLRVSLPNYPPIEFHDSLYRVYDILQDGLVSEEEHNSINKWAFPELQLWKDSIDVLYQQQEAISATQLP